MWARADPTPFTFAGNTFVQDGIADGGGFLAVGYSLDGESVRGRIWHTTTGRTWDLLDGGWLADVQFDHILRFGNGFAIVGAHREPDVGSAPGPSRPAVWWSVDGSTWEERTPAKAEALTVAYAAAGPAGLLLYVSDTRGQRHWLLATSDFQWTQLDATWPDDVRILGIAGGGPGWIATGATGIDTATREGGVSAGAIWTSTDAVTWSKAAVDEPGGSIGGVRRIGGGLLAIGDDRSIACQACLGRPIGRTPLVTWSSPDGLSWRRSSQLETSFGNMMGGNIVAGDGNRVLVFDTIEDGRLTVRESLDGATWSEVETLYLVAANIGDLSSFPDFNEVTIGSEGVVAFGHNSIQQADPTTPLTPTPWHASAFPPAEGAATFPPRPLPGANDVVCPGTEPCGP